ncbi:hypothetical protein GCM10028789_30760 [Sinomonas halotolerans]
MAAMESADGASAGVLEGLLTLLVTGSILLAGEAADGASPTRVGDAPSCACAGCGVMSPRLWGPCRGTGPHMQRDGTPHWWGRDPATGRGGQ